MITYNFQLDHRKTKRGTYNINFIIRANEVRKKIKTPVELTSLKDWNSKKQEVKSSCLDHEVFNEILSNIKKEAKEAALTNKQNKRANTSANIVSTMMAGDKCFSFIQFAEEFAKTTYENGDYRTYTKYITFLNKLKYFINGIKPEDTAKIPHSGEEYNKFLKRLKNDLCFEDINYSFLQKFKTYLKKIPNTKNPELTLSNNTISKQFDNFKSLYNKGIIAYRDEGLTIKNYPFTDFICETDETSKEKLTFDEIESLKKLKLEEGSLLWHSRNSFLFAFYCAGMRAGDLIQLRGTNIVMEDGNYRLCYRMDKTSSERNNILVPEAIEILSYYVNFDNLSSDYIFPYLKNDESYSKATTWELKERLPYEVKKRLLQQVNAKNVLINKYLTKLAAMANISKKISMHIARHSFANIARQKKANIYDISKSLGHTSISITEAYLSKFDHETQDATMTKVYTKDNSKEEVLLNQLKSLNPEELADLLSKLNG